ncbi:hypothetical protein WKK05_40640 (plasmid) [Nostoc sp. UHCC 0302]|uniref:hypothetical protein n=1 Tax=Nostoc sp. UHCC 0302 TaxID=3134896 RepID=UPI00311CCC3F
MSELQTVKLWDEWDEINLSSPKHRIERLEILLCQKVHRGEDISQCLRVLEYLKAQSALNKSDVESAIFHKVRNYLAFDACQKLSLVVLTYLLTFTCFIGLLKLADLFSNPSFNKFLLQQNSLSKTIPKKTLKHQR